jgi:hypothetical protein
LYLLTVFDEDEVLLEETSSKHSVMLSEDASLSVEFTMATSATLRFTRKQYTLKNPRNAQNAKTCRFPKPATISYTIHGKVICTHQVSK